MTDLAGEGSPVEDAVPQSSCGAGGGQIGRLLAQVRRRSAQVPLHLGQAERLARRRLGRLQVLVAGPLLQPRLTDTKRPHMGSETQRKHRLH